VTRLKWGISLLTVAALYARYLLHLESPQVVLLLIAIVVLLGGRDG